jgi:hypothetical protein
MMLNNDRQNEERNRAFRRTVYGNTRRNCMIGLPQRNVDLTLEKVFKSRT